MKHSLLILSFFLAFLPGLFALSPAFAAKDTGEGYAAPTFRDLSQMIVMMGGVDITVPKNADEYGRLFYCDVYQKKFKDDIEWNKIRSQIISRVQEKREYFHVLYESAFPFELGRYDFDTKSFPLTPETAMVNVGSIALFTVNEYTRYCGLVEIPLSFPPNITLLLNQPLTVDRFKIPVDKVEKFLMRMAEMKNTKRQIYGRLRFRVIEAPGPVVVGDEVVRSEIFGEVMSVDFFLDADLTKPLGKAQWR